MNNKNQCQHSVPIMKPPGGISFCLKVYPIFPYTKHIAACIAKCVDLISSILGYYF